MERIELHLHTNMSQMNGINSSKDYIKRAKEYGMQALAITDHAVIQAFPEAQTVADTDFKVIYGMEANIMTEDKKIYHATILAKNKVGIKNLYQLVSLSNIKYYNEKPIIPKDVYKQLSEGLILGSSCKKGELYQAILFRRSETEIKEIAKDYDYFEIQPICNNYCLIKDGIIEAGKALEDINKTIVALGDKLGKIVVATSNVHFLGPKDEIYKRILDTQLGKSEADNQPPLYFRTTEEMLKEFEYLGKNKAYEVVVTNTNKIADMCEKINPISNEKCYPYLPNSENDLKELAYKRAYELYGNPLPSEIQERLNKELNSIIKNNFSTLYMIAQKLIAKSNADGYIVGNRGSVGSSLVAYLIGITETDPIKYNIPFEIFAGFNGDKEPDIDLNFSGEYQKTAHKYMEVILGEGTTFQAGTVGTLAEKTAYEYVKAYFEQKGISTTNEEIEKLANGIEGIKRTTGHHPRRNYCCTKKERYLRIFSYTIFKR